MPQKSLMTKSMTGKNVKIMSNKKKMKKIVILFIERVNILLDILKFLSI